MKRLPLAGPNARRCLTAAEVVSREFSRRFGFRSVAGFGWIVLAVCLQQVAPSAAAPDSSSVSYALDVRSILSDKCFRCHGPDEASREADLRLDTSDGVEYAFAEGDREYSEAWRRIASIDELERMPPPEAKKPLSSAEIDVLGRWMEQGASWSGHWAFTPPKRTDPPNNSSDSCQPIDAFVLDRLQQASLEPAPLASKEALIRRVSFDLTGLPPTLEEIDAFVADDDPAAYERLVGRLLASPHLGERFASIWLDAARYSDTFGYQRDEDRFVWPWRDWVVRALNDNMPYDDFIRLQLAGDLVENATTDDVLATTFNRLHGQNSEGGSIPEEFRMEYVADRTQTFASAMLGLTMECCRCHDHKFDPLTIGDYYGLTAFFDKIDESGIKSYFTRATPTPALTLPSAEQSQQLGKLRAEVNHAENALADVVDVQRAEFAAMAVDTATVVNAPEPKFQNSFEEDVTAPNQAIDGVKGNAVRLTGDDEMGAAENCAFDRGDPFSICLWIRTDASHQRAVIFHRTRAALDSGSQGYELLLEDDRLSAALIHFWPGNALRIRACELLPRDRWVHVGLTYDGSSRAAGLRLYVDGAPADVEVVRDGLAKTALAADVDRIAVGARFRDRGFTNSDVDELVVFDRRLSPLEVAAIASPNQQVAVQEFDDDARFEHWLFTKSGAYRAALNQLQAVRRELFGVQDGVQEIMVMRNFVDAPTSRIRIRGAYDRLGDPVKPSVPAIFPPLSTDGPADRYTLANWLVHPDHPLTGRVAVNRLWQAVFGDGLVRTPEDFGAQGEPPTHPQLLDYLAVEFNDSGWDVKALIKRMVMSDTYRRSSVADQEAYELDPENRLLGRAQRRRWPAEMLRDNVLAASGLLVRRIGGPPVKPYEIEVSFAPSPRDSGEGPYRRSLYTYYKRSAPAPVLTAFDAPDRSVCRVKRERTKSPMQALVMLNGPQFVEAARVMAEKAIELHGDDSVSVVQRLFRLLTSQQPTDDELRVLDDLLRRQQRRFAKESERAQELLAVGDRQPMANLDPARVAATTIVAQTIMNYDKCVTRQ